MINSIIVKDYLHDSKFYDYILERILPLDYVLDDIPVCNLDSNDEKKLRNGQCIPRQLPIGKNSKIAIKSNGNLVAICVYCDGYLKPIKIF